MATHQDYLFRKNISRAISELLADPFSELTRKRQIALLIAATIAPLLSSGLVTLKAAEVRGAKFEVTAPHLAMWLAVAITGYLAVSYILGVWADWSIARAKRWSPLAKIGDVKAEIDADIKAQMGAVTASSEEVIRLSDELDKIDAELLPRIASNRARLNELNAALSPTKRASASPEESAHLVRLAEEYAELDCTQSALLDEWRDRKAPLMQDIVQSIAHGSGHSPWAVERGDIDKHIVIFRRLTFLRVMFEIFFPVVYAVLAIVWTARHA